MSKKLTEKQQHFLDVLFEEAKGDAAVAKKLAGYSDKSKTSEIVAALSEEIKTLTNIFFAGTSPRAAYSMKEIMDDPALPGNSEKIKAAKDVLDRAGYKPKEEVAVEAASPLFILPAKQKD